MSLRCALLLVLAPALLLSAAFANKKDAEAKALLQHAKQLSDIRAEGAPAFNMTINFRIVAKDGVATEGTYTEVWAAKSQWRKDTLVGGFRTVEVVNGRKHWLLDGITRVPQSLRDVYRLPDSLGFPPDDWRPQKIADKDRNGLSLRCLESDALSVCLDKTSGTFAYRVTSISSGSYFREDACSYSDYQKFGDRLVARSYACTEDKKVRMEARVVELIADPAPDQTLFTAPEGANESVNCLGRAQPPRVVRQESPDIFLPRNEDEIVLINMLVDTDGKPRDFKVLSPSNEDYNREALKALKQWVFEPGKCDGEKVEMTIAVKIDFHSVCSQTRCR